MYKVKIRIILLILVTVLIVAAISVFGSAYAVKAESFNENAAEYSAENIQPMFLTSISVGLFISNNNKNRIEGNASYYGEIIIRR